MSARKRSVGFGTRLRAALSGLIVALGTVFVAVLFPFVFGQIALGMAFFWPLLVVSSLVGLLLGALTYYQTVRRDRQDLDGDGT